MCVDKGVANVYNSDDTILEHQLNISTSVQQDSDNDDYDHDDDGLDCNYIKQKKNPFKFPVNTKSKFY